LVTSLVGFGFRGGRGQNDGKEQRNTGQQEAKRSRWKTLEHANARVDRASEVKTWNVRPYQPTKIVKSNRPSTWKKVKTRFLIFLWLWSVGSRVTPTPPNRYRRSRYPRDKFEAVDHRDGW
jgi:hypothetical protein